MDWMYDQNNGVDNMDSYDDPFNTTNSNEYDNLFAGGQNEQIFDCFGQQNDNFEQKIDIFNENFIFKLIGEHNTTGLQNYLSKHQGSYDLDSIVIPLKALPQYLPQSSPQSLPQMDKTNTANFEPNFQHFGQGANNNLEILTPKNYENLSITPLMFAAAAGYITIIDILIKYQSSVDATTIDGLNAVMISVIFGQLFTFCHFVTFFQANLSNSQIHRNNGYTILFYLVESYFQLSAPPESLGMLTNGGIVIKDGIDEFFDKIEMTLMVDDKIGQIDPKKSDHFQNEKNKILLLFSNLQKDVNISSEPLVSFPLDYITSITSITYNYYFHNVHTAVENDGSDGSDHHNQSNGKISNQNITPNGKIRTGSNYPRQNDQNDDNCFNDQNATIQSSFSNKSIPFDVPMLSPIRPINPKRVQYQGSDNNHDNHNFQNDPSTSPRTNPATTPKDIHSPSQHLPPAIHTQYANVILQLLSVLLHIFGTTQQDFNGENVQDIAYNCTNMLAIGAERKKALIMEQIGIIKGVISKGQNNLQILNTKNNDQNTQPNQNPILPKLLNHLNLQLNLINNETIYLQQVFINLQATFQFSHLPNCNLLLSLVSNRPISIINAFIDSPLTMLNDLFPHGSVLLTCLGLKRYDVLLWLLSTHSDKLFNALNYTGPYYKHAHLNILTGGKFAEGGVINGEEIGGKDLIKNNNNNRDSKKNILSLLIEKNLDDYFFHICPTISQNKSIEAHIIDAYLDNSLSYDLFIRLMVTIWNVKPIQLSSLGGHFGSNLDQHNQQNQQNQPIESSSHNNHNKTNPNNNWSQKSSQEALLSSLFHDDICDFYILKVLHQHNSYYNTVLQQYTTVTYYPPQQNGQKSHVKHQQSIVHKQTLPHGPTHSYLTDSLKQRLNKRTSLIKLIIQSYSTKISQVLVSQIPQKIFKIQKFMSKINMYSFRHEFYDHNDTYLNNSGSSSRSNSGKRTFGMTEIAAEGYEVSGQNVSRNSPNHPQSASTQPSTQLSRLPIQLSNPTMNTTNLDGVIGDEKKLQVFSSFANLDFFDDFGFKLFDLAVMSLCSPSLYSNILDVYTRLKIITENDPQYNIWGEDIILRALLTGDGSKYMILLNNNQILAKTHRQGLVDGGSQSNMNNQGKGPNPMTSSSSSSPSSSYIDPQQLLTSPSTLVAKVNLFRRFADIVALQTGSSPSLLTSQRPMAHQNGKNINNGDIEQGVILKPSLSIYFFNILIPQGFLPFSFNKNGLMSFDYRSIINGQSVTFFDLPCHNGGNTGGNTGGINNNFNRNNQQTKPNQNNLYPSSSPHPQHPTPSDSQFFSTLQTPIVQYKSIIKTTNKQFFHHLGDTFSAHPESLVQLIDIILKTVQNTPFNMASTVRPFVLGAESIGQNNNIKSGGNHDMNTPYGNGNIAVLSKTHYDDYNTVVMKQTGLIGQSVQHNNPHNGNNNNTNNNIQQSEQNQNKQFQLTTPPSTSTSQRHSFYSHQILTNSNPFITPSLSSLFSYQTTFIPSLMNIITDPVFDSEKHILRVCESIKKIVLQFAISQSNHFIGHSFLPQLCNENSSLPVNTTISAWLNSYQYDPNLAHKIEQLYPLSVYKRPTADRFAHTVFARGVYYEVNTDPFLVEGMLMLGANPLLTNLYYQTPLQILMTRQVYQTSMLYSRLLATVRIILRYYPIDEKELPGFDKNLDPNLNPNNNNRNIELERIISAQGMVVPLQNSSNPISIKCLLDYPLYNTQKCVLQHPLYDIYNSFGYCVSYISIQNAFQHLSKLSQLKPIQKRGENGGNSENNDNGQNNQTASLYPPQIFSTSMLKLARSINNDGGMSLACYIDGIEPGCGNNHPNNPNQHHNPQLFPPQQSTQTTITPIHQFGTNYIIPPFLQFCNQPYVDDQDVIFSYFLENIDTDLKTVPVVDSYHQNSHFGHLHQSFKTQFFESTLLFGPQKIKINEKTAQTNPYQARFETALSLLIKYPGNAASIQRLLELGAEKSLELYHFDSILPNYSPLFNITSGKLTANANRVDGKSTHLPPQQKLGLSAVNVMMGDSDQDADMGGGGIHGNTNLLEQDMMISSDNNNNITPSKGKNVVLMDSGNKNGHNHNENTMLVDSVNTTNNSIDSYIEPINEGDASPYKQPVKDGNNDNNFSQNINKIQEPKSTIQDDYNDSHPFVQDYLSPSANNMTHNDQINQNNNIAETSQQNISQSNQKFVSQQNPNPSQYKTSNEVLKRQISTSKRNNMSINSYDTDNPLSRALNSQVENQTKTIIPTNDPMIMKPMNQISPLLMIPTGVPGDDNIGQKVDQIVPQMAQAAQILRAKSIYAGKLNKSLPKPS